MYTPVSVRSSRLYDTVAIETAVNEASPHQLIVLLFEDLIRSLNAAKFATENRDIPAKARAIRKSVRILEEGLKAVLDDQGGGQIASNLRGLYEYCIIRTTQANLKNDASLLAEVSSLVQTIYDGWRGIGPLPEVKNFRR